VFPKFEFVWILPEFKRAMDMELDFHSECRNSEKAAEFFHRDYTVYIPKVYHVRSPACLVLLT
jgi:predicted unusual protein kinase regulating ubiquinone biosynthesis (AarF/ABC1/UbiB family)